MASQYWQEAQPGNDAFRVPDDVVDLLFRLCGSNLDIDHAWALAQALRRHLPADLCARIGVLGIRMAESGNGWLRPQQGDAALPLSRRARLVIRVAREDIAAVRQISRQILDMGAQSVSVGDSSLRPLSALGTLHARALRCDPEQTEDEFLAGVARQLGAMDITAHKMICGKAGEIRGDGETLFTRALLVAELGPEASVRLQQHGLGSDRLIGCGLFVPHKGIEPVYHSQK